MAMDDRAREVDVHLIAATSRDPRALVREGHLLEDLYYRLSLVELSIPPLRERSGDIPLLVDNFVRKPSPDFDGPPPVTFRPDALEFLQALPWRDDVWELGNLVRTGGQSIQSRPAVGRTSQHVAP